MALIPPDAGVRMRLPGDGPLQPTTPISGIPSDLPDLQPGQVFSARIQEVLPENTYRALVAGKTLTLALPEGAEAGDVLELVVIDRSAKAILARTVPEGAGAEAYKHTTLSPAAQLIGQLLSEEEGSHTAPLNRGQPLLNAPPTNAAPLAAALQRAVENSGMFYEAHQAQWVAGNPTPMPRNSRFGRAQWRKPTRRHPRPCAKPWKAAPKQLAKRRLLVAITRPCPQSCGRWYTSSLKPPPISVWSGMAKRGRDSAWNGRSRKTDSSRRAIPKKHSRG
jgi:hypothetical protein